jgi:hypothetical protein
MPLNRLTAFFSNRAALKSDNLNAGVDFGVRAQSARGVLPPCSTNAPFIRLSITAASSVDSTTADQIDDTLPRRKPRPRLRKAFRKNQRISPAAWKSGSKLSAKYFASTNH